jgi:hypothetical protein
MELLPTDFESIFRVLKNIVAPRCTEENKSLYVKHIYRLSTFAHCRTNAHKIAVQSGTKSGTEIPAKCA